MALAFRKVRGRDPDTEAESLEALERHLRERLAAAQRTLERFDENADRAEDMDDLVRMVAESESEVSRRASLPAREVAKPPPAPEMPMAAAGFHERQAEASAKSAAPEQSAHGGSSGMNDMEQLETIEKLAHDAGADARSVRESAERLFEAVAKHYQSNGNDARRSYALACEDDIGRRAYAVATEMAERELAVRSALGR